MKMKIKILFVVLAIFLFLAPEILAASSSFFSNAQNWYNSNCVRRPERARGQQAVLCYAFDKLNELHQTNDTQDQKITELEQRIEDLEVLHPTPTLTPISAKRVFITSTIYNGNLGGLAGADVKCQERVTAAGLGGSWKAWLSDDSISAGSRLTHNSGSYELINGSKIADSWEDLTDFSLDAPINISELNTTVNNPWVWTNTFGDGTIRQINNSSCINWSSTSSGGSTGDSSRTDGGWSDFGAIVCSSSRPLYCFEQ
ncbi:MAG: hypothetical protein A3H50_01410 [Candidatus Levybacteria bacterium RIFCSPLOWO2_02_FULL_37_10]|nr:MAG: hypothetical protein A2860_03125 [Candidatus Levybacteria bacterium RIFCSPHIGHO2_01_FULL_37_33]OGH29860.1 MAG: hypothetical protein A3F30_01565 [Candidatus Levybacteria bacterium RIFCSPHIGHO2_12_FULL_37_12]OGH43329.1 MAG: hypothetical protein A3H50_01410 [Candidatus Levybacteria bacterium RIFCSPLOWO2_02_FULL_37_10]